MKKTLPSWSMFRLQSSQILQKKLTRPMGLFLCASIDNKKNEKMLPDRTIFEGRWFKHSRLKYSQILEKNRYFCTKMYMIWVFLWRIYPNKGNRSATNTYRTTIRDLLARITAHSHHSFQRDTPKNILGKKMNYYRLLLLLE